MTSITRGVADTVLSTNFSNNQPTFFDYMSVPVEKAFKNNIDSYLAVLINHREKIFFIGQTSAITVYMGNVSRFFRSHDASVFAGLPSGAVAASHRGAHKYWSVEIVPATKDNWKYVVNALAGKSFVLQSQRGFLPPPAAMNICRITHTATGWSRFFSEEVGDNRSVNPSRRVGFQNGVEHAVRTFISSMQIKDALDVTAYQTLGSQLRLAIQTNAGVVTEVIRTFNGRSEIATVDTLVRNLNMQATRNFEKFLSQIKPRDYIGAKIGTLRADPVRHGLLFDIEKNHRATHYAGTDPATGNVAVVEEGKFTPTDSNSLNLSLEDIENHLLLTMKAEYRKDCDYIFSVCEKHMLNIDDVCSAFGSVLKHSGIWAQLFGLVTKDQIKASLYTNNPPDGLGFAGFFKIFRSTVDTLVRELEEA